MDLLRKDPADRPPSAVEAAVTARTPEGAPLASQRHGAGRRRVGGVHAPAPHASRGPAHDPGGEEGLHARRADGPLRAGHGDASHLRVAHPSGVAPRRRLPHHGEATRPGRVSGSQPKHVGPAGDRSGTGRPVVGVGARLHPTIVHKRRHAPPQKVVQIRITPPLRPPTRPSGSAPLSNRPAATAPKPPSFSASAGSHSTAASTSTTSSDLRSGQASPSSKISCNGHLQIQKLSPHSSSRRCSKSALRSYCQRRRRRAPLTGGFVEQDGPVGRRCRAQESRPRSGPGSRIQTPSVRSRGVRCFRSRPRPIRPDPSCIADAHEAPLRIPPPPGTGRYDRSTTE